MPALIRRLAAALAAVVFLVGAALPPPPSQLFGPLWEAVQLGGLFPDSKTFADAIPRRAPAQILADWRPGLSRQALTDFVAANFVLPPTPASDAAPAPGAPLDRRIDQLWAVLARPPLEAAPGSSQISLPDPYVVPGGRFREVYYWDSYFTLLGLMQDGRADLAKGLVDDFAGLIDRFGHMPNGARTYYLTRSQPPVFYLMVARLRPEDPASAWARYLPALRQEWRYWNDADLAPGTAGHLVRLADGARLNRYWDAADRPRDESWREDVALARQAGGDPHRLWREIRSTAESGWDFSSRWMEDPRSLASLQTTAIVPVDLQALLFGLERAIAQGCQRAGDTACATEFSARARARRQAMDRWLWDPQRGVYLDLDTTTGRRLDRPSAAMLWPLFTGAASPAQAHAVARFVRARLLAGGGLRTTLTRTRQQWDAPNGWAPLQWVAVAGLRRFGEDALARDIATRWIATVDRAYGQTGRLLEKYDVEEAAPGGGGEYPLQDGFGWTNGVTAALLALYPSDADTKTPRPGPGAALQESER